MGVLVYDGQGFEFDDRALAHIQAVITVKLRRREPFLLSWSTTRSAPARHSVWIDNAIPLRYEFDRDAGDRLDDAWLGQLMEMASRSAGVVLPQELADVSPLPQHRRRQTSARAAGSPVARSTTAVAV
ncbi:hypothetical protein ACIRCZ_12805 [Leifsonia sp. NPDC102414]|uniref:DUF7882 family protein n=1 Tax=Leifsonia sp. NPDC102414 TaxID=3364124 RepID=UPI0037F1B80A